MIVKYLFVIIIIQWKCMFLMIISDDNNYSNKAITTLMNYDNISGYNSITKTISKLNCYSHRKVSNCNKSTTPILSPAISYNTLLLNYGLSNITTNPSYIFHMSKFMDYLHIIRDTFYSTSFHFHIQHLSYYNILYEDNNNNSFTKEGKIIFNTSSYTMSNVYSKCGDYLISNYTYGSAFIISVVLNFKDNNDKQQFVTNKGTQFKMSSILNIMDAIYKSIINIRVEPIEIKVHAIQIRGNAFHNHNNTHNYEICKCNVNTISHCNEALNKLQMFVRNNFTLDSSNYVKLEQFGIGTHVVDHLQLNVDDNNNIYNENKQHIIFDKLKTHIELIEFYLTHLYYINLTHNNKFHHLYTKLNDSYYNKFIIDKLYYVLINFHYNDIVNYIKHNLLENNTYNKLLTEVATIIKEHEKGMFYKVTFDKYVCSNERKWLLFALLWFNKVNNLYYVMKDKRIKWQCKANSNDNNQYHCINILYELIIEKIQMNNRIKCSITIRL